MRINMGHVVTWVTDQQWEHKCIRSKVFQCQAAAGWEKAKTLNPLFVQILTWCWDASPSVGGGWHRVKIQDAEQQYKTCVIEMSLVSTWNVEVTEKTKVQSILDWKPAESRMATKPEFRMATNWPHKNSVVWAKIKVVSYPVQLCTKIKVVICTD